MDNENNRVCPVTLAGGLDNRIRRWLQNPYKILAPYVKEGMTALDIGCGPGFFTLAMAQLVGRSGRVIAADLQQGMLDKLQAKINGTEFEDRIALHVCGDSKLGVTEQVDFALAFYMVHEVVDQLGFFTEIRSILKAKGRMLIVEPPIHTSKPEFLATLSRAVEAGLDITERPKIFPNKVALLQKR